MSDRTIESSTRWPVSNAADRATGLTVDLIVATRDEMRGHVVATRS